MHNKLQSGKMGNDKKHASKELKRKKNNIEQKSEIVKKKKINRFKPKYFRTILN